MSSKACNSNLVSKVLDPLTSVRQAASYNTPYNNTNVFVGANVFLVAFNLNSENYWRNVGILAGMAIALNILAYILLRFVRKPKQ